VVVQKADVAGGQAEQPVDAVVDLLLARHQRFGERRALTLSVDKSTFPFASFRHGNAGLQRLLHLGAKRAEIQIPPSCQLLVQRTPPVPRSAKIDAAPSRASDTGPEPVRSLGAPSRTTLVDPAPTFPELATVQDLAPATAVSKPTLGRFLEG
jgi:hypothetical protein